MDANFVIKLLLVPQFMQVSLEVEMLNGPVWPVAGPEPAWIAPNPARNRSYWIGNGYRPVQKNGSIEP